MDRLLPRTKPKVLHDANCDHDLIAASASVPDMASVASMYDGDIDFDQRFGIIHHSRRILIPNDSTSRQFNLRLVPVVE